MKEKEVTKIIYLPRKGYFVLCFYVPSYRAIIIFIKIKLK